MPYRVECTGEDTSATDERCEYEPQTVNDWDQAVQLVLQHQNDTQGAHKRNEDIRIVETDQNTVIEIPG